jgi:hypothetical protein
VNVRVCVFLFEILKILLCGCSSIYWYQYHSIIADSKSTTVDLEVLFYVYTSISIVTLSRPRPAVK